MLSLRYDPPHGELARRALSAVRRGERIEVLLDYPLSGEEAPRMQSGEIRDRVRFHLREMARLTQELGLGIRHARPEGWLARTAARDPRIARALAHGVQASFTGILLRTETGSLLAREARRLGLL